jgi:hypothetical protein
VDGHAYQVRFLQDSLGTTQEMECKRCMEKYYEVSLVSRGYSSGLIKIDDLSVDSSTVAAKKGGNK